MADRHHVRGDVQDGLNGDLQRVLDEAFLHDVGGKISRAGESAQLPDGCFDEGKLLGDEIGIGQGPGGRAAR